MADAGGVTLKEIMCGRKAPCPLIGNLDGVHTSLLTVLDAMQTDLEDFVIQSPVVDLSGTGTTEVIFYADQAYTIVSCTRTYVELTSADAGVNTEVGKLIVGTDDPNYFVDQVASTVSKEAGFSESQTLLQTAIAAGDVLTFTNAGGKTGTGTCFVSLVLRKS